MITNVLWVVIVIAVAIIVGLYNSLKRLERNKVSTIQPPINTGDKEAVEKLQNEVKELQRVIKQKDNDFQSILTAKQKEYDLQKKQQQLRVDDGFAKIKNTHEQEKVELRIKLMNDSHEEQLKFKEYFTKYEVANIQKRADENALQVAKIAFDQWVAQNKAHISERAIKNSHAVNFGLITQHLIPFYNDFNFNHKDVRFMGNPIDLVIFDGLTDEKDDITIYIVEVKTGTSKLNKAQQKIRRACENRRIVWKQLNPSTMDIDSSKIEGELF